MIIKNFLKEVFLVIGLVSMSLGFIYPNTTHAEIIEKTFEASANYMMGDDETRQQAEDKAFNKAKRRAVEQALTSVNDKIPNHITIDLKIIDKKTSWDYENTFMTCTVSIIAKVKIDMEDQKSSTTKESAD